MVKEALERSLRDLAKMRKNNPKSLFSAFQHFMPLMMRAIIEGDIKLKKCANRFWMSTWNHGRRYDRYILGWAGAA